MRICSASPVNRRAHSDAGEQLELIQQPEDYNAGSVELAGTVATVTPLTFASVDFQGGAAYPGEIDESTVQAGDYFVLCRNPDAASDYKGF